MSRKYSHKSFTAGPLEFEVIRCYVGGRQKPSVEILHSQAARRSIVAFIDVGPWTVELRTSYRQGLLVKSTTFRSFLRRHPDTLFLHHQGETFDTAGLTTRIATYLDCDAYEDEEAGVIYTFREIARIVRPDEEDEL